MPHYQTKWHVILKWIRNCFDDAININNKDPENIKVDKKPNKNIFVYFIGFKVSNHLKSLFVTFNKINGYIEDSLGIIKCLTLIPFDGKRHN